MRLAFCLFKYFPFGGLQRDFLRIALTCQARGYAIRVYVLQWEGEVPEGFELVRVPVLACSNHRRYRKFSDWVAADLLLRPVDRVIGFNKMPGLDVYYAADTCFEDKVQDQRRLLYRLSGRYRLFAAFERAVFRGESTTHVLTISRFQAPVFIKYYNTPAERFHMLPPGIGRDRLAGDDAARIRAAFRAEFSLAADDILLLQIGSGFKTKGLDRSLKALAALPEAQRQHTRLFAIGQDNPKPFQAQARKLGVEAQVRILQGRNDIPRFLLGGDLLIHPAYNENTGTVLLEALASGLPVLVTDVCGYTHYVSDADAGRVIASPFTQAALNTTLAEMINAPEMRARWGANGLAFAREADIYSLHERATDIILGPLNATTDNIRLVSADDLVAAGRRLSFPFVIRLEDGSELQLQRPLRVLPRKRVVGEGYWRSQHVAAKLFISSKSERDWCRETDGLAALAAVDIPTAPCLGAGRLMGGGYFVLTGFLDGAMSLAGQMTEALLAEAANKIGKLHTSGFIHTDPHPENFLNHGGMLHLIDGAAISRYASPAKAVDNLALFLSEAPVEMPLDRLLAAYDLGFSGHVSDPARLVPLIKQHRRQRLNDYLKKTLRNCTQFATHQHWGRFSAVTREDAGLLQAFIADPDRIMAAGTLIKTGGTATVVQIEQGGVSLIAKRYNIKSLQHALSRALRPSRAWHSWVEAHRLRFLGIATPRPRVLIEERFGHLRHRAWLVNDFHPGKNLFEMLADHVNAQEPPQAVGTAIIHLAHSLNAYRISHGDFKATNLLWDEDKQCIVLIDLDAMTQHRCPSRYARAWRRDRARFLANWPNECGLHRWLDQHLPR